MRTNCIVCGAKLLDAPLYAKHNMPAFSQNLPQKEDLEEDKPMEYRICQCSGCGLVQFDCEPVSYYKDSTRAGERCEALIELRKKQYKHLIEKYSLNGKKILEVGAGKGGFLKTLKEMDEYHIEEYGIENNSRFVSIAREDGINVFEGDAEKPNTEMMGAPYDAFVSFAYPARLIDPNAMLQNVYNNTVDDAVGLIQVPSMEHLLREGGFFDITCDHIAYYDESSLRFLLQKNGFDVLEFGEVSLIYIYAIVKKRQPYDLKKVWEDNDTLIDSFRSFVERETGCEKKIAIWCAGHYAFTILALSNTGENISYIIDNSAYKQGRYSPVSHVPIFGPEHFKENPVNSIVILGPIYIKEIANEIRSKCSRYVGIYTIEGNEVVQIEDYGR